VNRIWDLSRCQFVVLSLCTVTLSGCAAAPSTVESSSSHLTVHVPHEHSTVPHCRELYKFLFDFAEEEHEKPATPISFFRSHGVTEQKIGQNVVTGRLGPYDVRLYKSSEAEPWVSLDIWLDSPPDPSGAADVNGCRYNDDFFASLKIFGWNENTYRTPEFRSGIHDFSYRILDASRTEHPDMQFSVKEPSGTILSVHYRNFLLLPL